MIRNHAAFIWSVADLLRGDYKQSEYGKVILPLTVILSLITTSTSNAAVWRDHGSKFTEHYERLRDSAASDTKRDELMNELREAAAADDSYNTAAW